MYRFMRVGAMNPRIRCDKREKVAKTHNPKYDETCFTSTPTKRHNERENNAF